jgi:hypothetical protein
MIKLNALVIFFKSRQVNVSTSDLNIGIALYRPRLALAPLGRGYFPGCAAHPHHHTMVEQNRVKTV